MPPARDVSVHVVREGVMTLHCLAAEVIGAVALTEGQVLSRRAVRACDEHGRDEQTSDGECDE